MTVVAVVVADVVMVVVPSPSSSSSVAILYPRRAFKGNDVWDKKSPLMRRVTPAIRKRKGWGPVCCACTGRCSWHRQCPGKPSRHADPFEPHESIECERVATSDLVHGHVGKARQRILAQASLPFIPFVRSKFQVFAKCSFSTRANPFPLEYFSVKGNFQREY